VRIGETDALNLLGLSVASGDATITGLRAGESILTDGATAGGRR
jgi:hypothetical protein